MHTIHWIRRAVLGCLLLASLVSFASSSMSPQSGFAIAATPSSLSIPQTGQGVATISTTISGGFNNPIALSATGVPVGVSVTFSPKTIVPPGAGSSIMSVVVSRVAPIGTFSISVVGTAGISRQTTTVALTITAQAQAGFTLAAAPSSLNVVQGTQTNSVIYSTINGAFNNAISLSASGMPSDTTISFNPQSIPAPGLGTSSMTVTVAGDTPAGTYPITITGTGGAVQQNTILTLTVMQAPSFTLSASPGSVTLQQGNQGGSTVTTTILGAFNSGVSLSVSGMPFDSSVSFSPQTIPAPGAGSSSVTISVASDTPPGTYPLTITGTGGGIQQTTTLSLTVTPMSSFTLSALPNSVTVQQGNQGSSTVTTAIIGGFNSAISLSAGGMPTDTTVSFSPQTIAAPGAGNSSVTITVAGDTPVGTYPITITGTGAGIQQNAILTLTVTQAPTFTLSASPGSVTVQQGNQGGSTVTTAVSGGFNNAISLSASGMPTDTSVSFNPQTIAAPGAGSSSMTIAVAADTPVGTYSITVTGSGGGIQQNTVVSLTVTAPPSDFTIAVSPGSVTTQIGLQGTSGVTTTISGNYNNTINLSASGMPAGTTVSFNPQAIPAPGAGSSSITVAVGSNTPLGTYPIVVTGDDGTNQHSATLNVTVSSWSQGFDFRNTAGFVTDPPNYNPVLPATNYPDTVNGVTFGWTTQGLVQGEDRNTLVDPRLAGMNSAQNGTPSTFSVNLPSPGTYNLALAMGDDGSAQCGTQCQIQFLDGSTVVATVTGGPTNEGYFYDAVGNNWLDSVWPTSNVSQQVTIAGTALTVVVGTNNATGDVTPIASLAVTQMPTFTLSASPSSLSIQQGNQGSSVLTTAISGGFNNGVTLSATGVPSGTTISFSPQTIPSPGGGSSTLTFTVGSTPPGTYSITVTGAGGGVQQNTVLSLTVTQSPSFTISASPSGLSVQQGNQGNSTLTTAVSGGFNNAISLSATGMPAGTSVSFNPQTIPAPGAGTSFMTISVGTSTPAGTYPITVTGSGGGIQQNTIVTLTVTVPAVVAIQFFGDSTSEYAFQSDAYLNWPSQDFNKYPIFWNSFKCQQMLPLVPTIPANTTVVMLYAGIVDIENRADGTRPSTPVANFMACAASLTQSIINRLGPGVTIYWQDITPMNVQATVLNNPPGPYTDPRPLTQTYIQAMNDPNTGLVAQFPNNVRLIPVNNLLSDPSQCLYDGNGNLIGCFAMTSYVTWTDPVPGGWAVIFPTYGAVPRHPEH